MGLEGVILIPALILASAAVLYYSLRSTRDRQLARRPAPPGDTPNPHRETS